ncbi:MAG: hypothetical protein AABW59_01025 [archaeon]
MGSNYIIDMSGSKVRFIAIAIFAFFLINSAYALSYTVTLHSINMQVDTEGKASVIEKFFMIFPNDTEKISFRDQSKTLGLDISTWTNFDSRFKTSIGQNNITNTKIIYNEGEANYLEISYDLTDSLMAKGKETNMVTEYSIKATFLNDFYQSGIWVIPDGTSISIELPPGAETKDQIEPQAAIINAGARKVITWQGYKSSNKITLDYILWKKITPVVDLNSIVSFLFKTTEGLALIAAIIVLLFVTIIFRKKIFAKLEEFVENNSIIEEE